MLSLYDKRLKELETEKKKLITLYGRSEIITIEELEEKVSELKMEIIDVNEERQKLIEAKDGFLEKRKHLDTAVEHFKSIESRLDEFSDAEKKKLVELLFSRITVDWDEEKGEYNLDIEVQVPIFRDEDMCLG